MNSLNREYNNFMKWFEEAYPDLHEKYGRNIKIPFQLGGGVSVTNDFQISDQEHQMLVKIANEYYGPPPSGT